MATAAEMVTALQTALAAGGAEADVVSITVDGRSTTFNRAAARAELEYWERKAARESGSRPVVGSIDLGALW